MNEDDRVSAALFYIVDVKVLCSQVPGIAGFQKVGGKGRFT
jgi:hypothetical protein